MLDTPGFLLCHTGPLGSRGPLASLLTQLPLLAQSSLVPLAHSTHFPSLPLHVHSRSFTRAIYTVPNIAKPPILRRCLPKTPQKCLWTWAPDSRGKEHPKPAAEHLNPVVRAKSGIPPPDLSLLDETDLLVFPPPPFHTGPSLTLSAKGRLKAP